MLPPAARLRPGQDEREEESRRAQDFCRDHRTEHRAQAEGCSSPGAAEHHQDLSCDPIRGARGPRKWHRRPKMCSSDVVLGLLDDCSNSPVGSPVSSCRSHAATRGWQSPVSNARSANIERPFFKQPSSSALPDLQCGPVLMLGGAARGGGQRASQHVVAMSPLSDGSSGAEEQSVTTQSMSGQKTKTSIASSSSSRSKQQRRGCVCDEDLVAARIEGWAERGARKRQAKLQSAW